ncbi:MAG: ABC transporter substrate-binding protein [Anaerolineales bacterium]
MEKISIKTLISFLLLFFILGGCSPNNIQVNDQSVTSEVPNNGEEAFDENVTQDIVSILDYNLTGTNFRIMLLGSDEQPYQDAFRSIHRGVEDAISFFNEAGGVFGANIILDVQSIDLADEDYIIQLLEIMFAEDPHIVLMAIPVDEKLYEKLNAQSIPVLYFGVGGVRLPEKSAGRDNLFWLTPLPDEQMAFVFELLRDNWKKISPSPAFPEMIGAYLTWEGRLGSTAYTDELDAYFSDRAFQLAVQDTFAVSPNASVTNALINSLTSNVGVIYTDTFSFGPATIANDLTSLGIKDFFVLSGSVWCCDNLDSYLYAPPFEGDIYVTRSIVWWSEESNPAIDLAKDIAAYNKRQDRDLSFGYLLGLGVVDIITEVLKLTVKEEKSGDFRAKSVYPMGGLFEVDYTNRNRSPNHLRLWHYDHQNGWQVIGEIEKVPALESAGD